MVKNAKNDRPREPVGASASWLSTCLHACMPDAIDPASQEEETLELATLEEPSPASPTSNRLLYCLLGVSFAGQLESVRGLDIVTVSVQLTGRTGKHEPRTTKH